MPTIPAATSAICASVSRSRILWRPENSAMYRCRCFGESLWYVPAIPRLNRQRAERAARQPCWSRGPSRRQLPLCPQRPVRSRPVPHAWRCACSSACRRCRPHRLPPARRTSGRPDCHRRDRTPCGYVAACTRRSFAKRRYRDVASCCSRLSNWSDASRSPRLTCVAGLS